MRTLVFDEAAQTRAKGERLKALKASWQAGGLRGFASNRGTFLVVTRTKIYLLKHLSVLGTPHDWICF